MKNLSKICRIAVTGFVSLASAGVIVASDFPLGPVPDSVPPPPVSTLGIERLREEFNQPSAGRSFNLRDLTEGRLPWLTNRISRCFFGPIKRPPYNHDELMDDVDYYPDSYLETLESEGVNGLWLTVEFRDLARTSFTQRAADATRRLNKLRQIVSKCAKHGIRIWLFAIEPREVDFRRDALALAHPDWIGCKYDDLRGAFCPSHPEVAQYLEESVRDIFTQVPGLGGLINISNGERVTTCLSLRGTEWFTCARCANIPEEELHRRVALAMVKGMKAVDPAAELISWIYRPVAEVKQPEWIARSAGVLPDGVIQQNNFETGVILEQEGRKHVGGDYWLSCPGPSDSFARVAKVARSAGRRMSAKIQVSCSHEIATIPVLPVPGLLYRKFKGMHDAGVTDAMYCWYFGSAPGIMTRAAGLLAYEDFSKDEATFLLRLAKADWGEDAAKMANVWGRCSEAFAKYPLSNLIQYYGPFHQGVVWPLRADVELRPLGSTWEPDQPAGGDLIGECLGDFDLREVVTISEKMYRAVEPVKPILAELECRYADNIERRRDLGLVHAFCNHLEAARDVFAFYSLRRDALASSRGGDCTSALRDIAEMKDIVRREKALTRRMKSLCQDDARLGYHSEAENYQYYPSMFDWRERTLFDTERRLVEIENELKRGHGYPLSSLEQKAPRFPACLTKNGDLVLEGEAKGRGSVSLWLYDSCGTVYPRSITIEPQGGRFRCVVSSSDWGNDARLRPAWIQIHQGCDYRGDSWRWPGSPGIRWRWFQGDRLGYCSARIVLVENK